MSEPYYSDDLVTLYHGDCREVQEWLAADVLVTDPPYGVRYVSGWTEKNPIEGDLDTGVRDEVLAAWGAARPALIFGRWNVDRPNGTRHRLIWDKGDSPGMGDLAMPWGHADEEIYVLGRGFVGPRGTNIIRSKVQSVADKTRPKHPTPKPVSLMEVLIDRCPAGVIADPFVGSGSTLLAASYRGRRAIGIEREERYCEMAARRFAQGTLFDVGDAS